MNQKIYYRLLNKLYFSFRNVANEQLWKEKKQLLSSINCNLDKVWFGEIAQFLGGEYISIGDGTSFGNGIYLTAWDKYKCMYKGVEMIQTFTPRLEIGRNCHLGAYNHITCINEITIGENLLTGKWITITDNSHGTTDVEALLVEPIKRPLYSKGPVRIGNNVWIGDKATILPRERSFAS